jgi:hypothetical protein
MTRSLFSWLLTVGTAAFLTGCVATELNVTNSTGGSIQFYTGHTKKAVAIP